MLHTEADFDRMKAKVAAKEAPWIDGWEVLQASAYANPDWKPEPRPIIYAHQPGFSDNAQYLQWDVTAAYQNALVWKITGDTAAADCAVRIMNAWSSTLTEIAVQNGAYDGYLVAGLQGYQFANVGELMRGYAGLSATDFTAFQAMMLNVFQPMNGGGVGDTPWAINDSVSVFSNWGLCAMAASLATGVLCDNQKIVDAVIDYFKSGLGNGAINMMTYYLHPGFMGQTQESGRDQGHNSLSVALASLLCEMAWNQGIDLYGYDNNRVLSACEYVAKGNLIESGSNFYEVPFVTYQNTTGFATGGQGAARAAWAQIYNHYVNRRGLAAPFSEMFAKKVAPEPGPAFRAGGGAQDQPGLGTLTFSRDPIAAGSPPSGLVALTSGSDIVLSWWGTAYASSYTVKRATQAGGPYTVVATGISELRTWTDASPAPGIYYYVVTAQTPSGESARSNEAMGMAGTYLQARWPFDEGQGTSARDGNSNGNRVQLIGGAGWGTGRSGGSALQLAGGGACAALPADILSDVADFSITAWVNWTGGQTWERIFDLGADRNHYMFLTPRGGNGVVRFECTLTQNGPFFRIDGRQELPRGQWTHVAVTLSGTTLTLFVNGVAVGSNGDVFINPFQLRHTTQNWIGKSQWPNDPTFNGLVQDFRIYRGALTASQVAAMAAS
ncbi:LamG-like jellyroll fold domain-containing protein [Ideonella sp. YS5]|uniref:LamG-like jellyroll fold domain-containing protein n=1 Tax=Ideonella sp. YS5 TaxID=3453714 RepID=UPI003F7029D2